MEPSTNIDSLKGYVDRLREMVADLWYPSEVDAPLEVVVWPVDRLDESRLGQLLGREAESVQRLPAGQFFQPIVSHPFWRTAQADHLAQRYEALQQMMVTTLADLQTYRVGAVEVAIYLVGLHPSGSYVGLQTTVVET